MKWSFLFNCLLVCMCMYVFCLLFCTVFCTYYCTFRCMLLHTKNAPVYTPFVCLVISWYQLVSAGIPCWMHLFCSHNLSYHTHSVWVWCPGMVEWCHHSLLDYVICCWTLIYNVTNCYLLFYTVIIRYPMLYAVKLCYLPFYILYSVIPCYPPLCAIILC